jgi:DNA methylase/Putative Ig domain
MDRLYRMSATAVPEPAGNMASEFARIDLVWPGKDISSVVRQDTDGRWHMDVRPKTRRLHPLVDLAVRGDESSASSALVIAGDRLAALGTLRRHYPRRVTFAYVDAPRIEIDDQAAAFKGDPTYAYSTWLSVLRAHIDAIVPLMSRTGVVALLTGDLEEPYARLLLADAIGRDNYVGTVVWQRSYGPRNMRGMKEFTATHDCIVLFAVDKGALPAVGLRRDAADAGFANPDGDLRGPWRAAHKGARTRRERSDFNTYVPPYRWQIVEGRLPEGLWRLNPLTGVIWGTPTEPGEFPVTVEVRDSSGATARAEIVVRILETGDPPELPTVPWVFEEIATRGRLRISGDELPAAVLNLEYSAVLTAEGGKPHRAQPKRPGSGRYWEFADETLRTAYACDMVDLGVDGDVIPRIKTYAMDLGEEVVQNQQTWWPSKAKDGSPFAGFTQDATKHLKKLRELGFVAEAPTTSKPEHLLARLLSIFTRSGDLALEVFGSTGDLAAVAIKMRRDCVYLAGDSARERSLLEGCAIGRLEAVVDGNDNDLHERAGDIRMSADAYLPFAGGGGFVTCRVGEWLFEQGDLDDFPRMNRAFASVESIAPAILTAQGFLPDVRDPFRGSGAGGSRAVVVPPEEYLTPDLASRLVSTSGGGNLTIFYFMASDDFDPSLAPASTGYRRIPTEVALFE